ncbi:TPA: hypothetical protein I8649_001986 [Legionella pneumophila]|nr:hypothetical protein [Legionella pneumophila]
MFGKYTSLVLAGICAAGTASSGTMGPVCTSTLCAFAAPGGLYGSITGYYLKPSESGIGQVSDSWQYAVPNGVLARSKPFQPDHEWEGGFTFGYDVPNSANNIELNFFRLSNDTHAVNGLADGPISFGSVFFPDAAFGPLPAGFVSDAHLKYTLNQVDFRVGRKYTDANGHFSLKPSLGLRYADLEHSLTFIAPGNVISDYKGAGPLFSLDGNYRFANSGFGLVGHFDYALLVGQINSNSFVNLGGFNFQFASPKTDRIVSSVTGKLGVDYSYMFSNAASVTLEAGYQVSDYINGIDIIRGTLGFVPGTVQHIAGIESTSFTYRGPYVTLSVHA